MSGAGWGGAGRGVVGRGRAGRHEVELGRWGREGIHLLVAESRASSVGPIWIAEELPSLVSRGRKLLAWLL